MLFLVDSCTTLAPVISFLKAILGIIQWGIPILLIIMGSIDLGKAVMASDDKEIKGATSKLIKRAIAAVAVFFIPMIVNLLINMVSDSDAATTSGGQKSFIDCWADPGTGTGA
jgi:hypothetical protein